MLAIVNFEQRAPPGAQLLAAMLGGVETFSARPHYGLVLMLSTKLGKEKNEQIKNHRGVPCHRRGW